MERLLQGGLVSTLLYSAMLGGCSDVSDFSVPASSPNSWKYTNLKYPLCFVQFGGRRSRSRRRNNGIPAHSQFEKQIKNSPNYVTIHFLFNVTACLSPTSVSPSVIH